MKFSSNGLYVEEYVKCTNCGTLIYESDRPACVESTDKELFCSQWCVDWAAAREKRWKQNA